ncbi:MAG: dihydroorotate dehydrogenase electron transfer subunit [Candidatus Diapherotrites archaeon]|nr:dihydroorotate dehydrogenase electron transfer subunit [Candidatus Diapherotrites archaeon]
MPTSDYPVSYPIKKIVSETPSIKTFYLDSEISSSPGQFVMVWIPGFDEKPFALTKNGKEIAITAKKRGAFTEKLFSLKEGSLLGIRGPYGKGFEFKGAKKACIVAGGIGMAAVILLAEEMAKKKIKIDFVQACRCKEEVLFEKRIGKIAKLHVATDDGSCGVKGNACTVLEKLLKEKKFDCVYCCGPEPMMVSVLALCNKFKAPAQFAVERYMKCAHGICGNCSLDEHLCCKDGPVFAREQLGKSKEFGKTHYEKSGKKTVI